MRKFPHRVGFRTALLAVVGLLIAQWGATTHAYTHDLAGLTSQRTTLSSHDPCHDCLAFAPLLSAAASPSLLPALQPQGGTFDPLASGASLIDLAPALAFRSRAPPVRA